MQGKSKDAYLRPCKFCGDSIIMIKLDNDNWQPFELDGSGRHEHGTNTSNTIYSVRNIPTPLTYPIKCWECRQNVFFHTNGNGDVVLFDNLGAPWEVHACWEDLRKEPHHFDKLPKRSHYVNRLQFPWAEYNKGYFNLLERKLVNSPSSQNSVVGYVAHNPYNEKRYGLIDPSYDASMKWSRLDVCDQNQNIFPFIIPNSLAIIIEDYSIVSIKGDWIERPEGYFLKATKIEILQYEYDYKSKKDKVRRKSAEAKQRFGELKLVDELRNPISQEKFLRLKT